LFDHGVAKSRWFFSGSAVQNWGRIYDDGFIVRFCNGVCSVGEVNQFEFKIQVTLLGSVYL